MYRQFFGLEKRPFILSPDPEFLYLSFGHDLALTHLEYGLLHNVGFVALTGEVGAGKTTLLKYLLEKISSSISIALVLNTNLDPQALLETLVKEFELQPKSPSKTELVDSLFQHFLAEYSKGHRCVIIIDEAQNLPLEGFEELRMLSNLEAGNEFLVQIVLVGQPQLRERLWHPALSQLTQRISVHYHLTPLSKDEVGSYIAHRLKVSGYHGEEPLFSGEAIDSIATFSGGIPRVINSICDTALTYAFADEALMVSEELIRKVISDNELLFVPFKPNPGDEGPGHAVSASGGPFCGPVPLGGADLQPGMHEDFKSLLISLNAQLRSLESRVKTLEASEQSEALKVLQQMLAKERRLTMGYARKASVLSAKCSNLLSQFKQREESDAPSKKKPQERGTFWRLLSGNKK